MQLAIHRLNFKPALDPRLGFFAVLETKMRHSQVTVTDGFIGEKIKSTPGILQPPCWDEILRDRLSQGFDDETAPAITSAGLRS